MERFDVVVVGAGSAAFEAAVAARQSGAERVVLLEKAPEPHFGGNARVSSTGFRFVHSGAAEMHEFIPQVPDDEFATMAIPPYTEEDFTGDLMRVTQGRIDTELAAVIVGDSNEALHWMLETGIKFAPARSRDADGMRYFEPGCIIQMGSRGEQLPQWRRIVDDLGIELRFESWVTALHGNVNQIEGLQITTPSGTSDLEARSVILCAGGFQAHPERRARYLGPNADFMKVRGSRYDTGEVLMAAIDMGAKPAGQWQGAHASPIDADAPAFGGEGSTIRYDYPFGITVNMLGERFFDEGEAAAAYTYAKTGRRLLEQPGSVSYQLYDQQLRPLMAASYRDAPHAEADTIGELATRIGIRPELLERTVEEFNAAVRDDIPFDPSRLDGRSTAGISPVKSNWATRLESAPFLAYAVTGGITFTFGGLGVNAHGQVLNTMDEPIAGLYASGDILGLFFHNYPAFSGQTRNVVFSRRAALHATN